jgi:hypothetical protein
MLAAQEPAKPHFRSENRFSRCIEVQLEEGYPLITERLRKSYFSLDFSFKKEYNM